MFSPTMKSFGLCILLVVVGATVSSAETEGPIALQTAQTAATAGLPPGISKVDSFKRFKREPVELNKGESHRRVARESSEEDESCKPTKADHGAKMCCELPLVFRGTPELLKACKEEMGFPDHKPPPPPPSSEGHGPHGPQRGMCVAECLFNRTGLLESGKINKEALKKVLDEYLKTDEAWRNVATSSLEICYDVQTKGDFKPDHEKFTSGSSEFLRCFSRNLFMDCIPEKWTDSEECKNLKMKIEKCPKMVPPFLFNKRPH
ncbi:hypothetical protein LSTR_LSTR008205 [Laodelphax striatellus]|uniref:OBP47-like domain-containing protein n=1 Tax=Laodelphax striatellus TaxID=195883 RepID=A0A482WJ49_LAOST|nr:hypothetical protein LSTR_LSTR008205 [Laodelphax striatellus]